MPSVCAVIINFNGGDCIVNCVRALYRQDFPLEAIIVVDNGSTDGSPDRVRANFPDVQLVELSKEQALPKARNIGLKLATTDLVLMIDDDVYVSKDCLSYLLDAYRRDQPTVVCPRVILLPESDIVQADGGAAHFVGTMVLRHGNLPVEEASAEVTNVGGCLGACLLVHRARVLSAGGFDEAYFFYLEDHEFSLRLRSLGYRLVCEPAAVVFHDRGLGTLGLSFRGEGTYPSSRAYLMTRHRLMTLFIHYSVRTLVVLLPALAFYEFACLVVSLLRGWGREWVRAWLWQLHNAKAILWRRKRVQRMRLVKDRDLLVGGPLPLVPGFIRSSIEGAAVSAISKILNAYWSVANRWIG